jgi:hypothetical protein
VARGMADMVPFVVGVMVVDGISTVGLGPGDTWPCTCSIPLGEARGQVSRVPELIGHAGDADRGSKINLVAGFRDSIRTHSEHRAAKSHYLKALKP